MARTTITQITDDLDGSKDASEVSFAFDGTHYTIDLSNKNRTALQKLLKPYIEAGTKVTKRSGRTKASAARGGQSSAVREWAKAQGIEVSERGRIPKSVLDQYDAVT
jgi:hypothetical protein